MRRYNGYAITQDDSGDLVRYSDVKRLINGDILAIDNENTKLKDALDDLKRKTESLLNSINRDKDGGYFICEEAQHEIDAVQEAIDNAVVLI